jgi:molybdopterin/thiamine biosynthesis adenylyltransferase
MVENREVDLRKELESLKLPDNQNFKPMVFRKSDFEQLADLIKSRRPTLHDNLESQVKELFKIRNPHQKLDKNQLNEHFAEWSKTNDAKTYGVYAYYPWSNRLIHLLDEAEFIELRTSRNKHKITEEEQELLSKKVIGIIGLSVGQSVAMTAATERVAGTLRIADFDDLELSNLNRIRTGVHNLGLQKTTMVAREIAELDPFIKVEVFEKGITPENIDLFLGSDIKLDLLIEVCDSLPIKILSRVKARAAQIPVLMDTSDRGMVDVERFDIEHDREILHGKVGVESLDDLAKLGPQEMMALLMKMVDFENLSPRMKHSFSELGKTITTWPQLASDVIVGGGISTKIARRILLGEHIKSNRYYLDRTEEI